MRKLSEKENLATSEINKPLIVEKVQIQAQQTKSAQKDKSAGEKSSRFAVVRSYASSRKVILGVLFLACVAVIGASIVLWNPGLSISAIMEVFPNAADHWLIQKPLFWSLGLIVCVVLATMILFRKSLAKKLPRPFAKKQA